MRLGSKTEQIGTPAILLVELLHNQDFFFKKIVPPLKRSCLFWLRTVRKWSWGHLRHWIHTMNHLVKWIRKKTYLKDLYLRKYHWDILFRVFSGLQWSGPIISEHKGYYSYGDRKTKYHENCYRFLWNVVDYEIMYVWFFLFFPQGYNTQKAVVKDKLRNINLLVVKDVIF